MQASVGIVSAFSKLHSGQVIVDVSIVVFSMGQYGIYFLDGWDAELKPVTV